MLVAWHTTAANDYITLRFNGDAGANYFSVYARGKDAGVTSNTNNGSNEIFADSSITSSSTSPGLFNINIMDYSATDKHKTALSRLNVVSGSSQPGVSMASHRWANTSAITSILVKPYSGNFTSGSTFALFGIAS